MAKIFTHIGKTRYIPLTEWNNYHPWPKTRTFRYMIYKGINTDLKHVIVKVGRRWVIDEKAFFEWMEEKKMKIHTE